MMMALWGPRELPQGQQLLHGPLRGEGSMMMALGGPRDVRKGGGEA